MKTLNVRQERLKHGWTLEFVAKSIGITNQSISLIETGQNKPSYDVLCKLEDLFNLTHRQLFAVADDNDNQSGT